MMAGSTSVALGVAHSVSHVIIKEEEEDAPQRGACASCCIMSFSWVMTLVNGWKIYMRQSIVLAGLSLAAIYMTVMAFDNITNGKNLCLCTSRYKRCLFCTSRIRH
jgi:iron-regulated transporter 1